jgi:hypothetical protein
MKRPTARDLIRLARMRQCQQEADVEHTDEQVRAAARALGRESHLPDPEQLELMTDE